MRELKQKSLFEKREFKITDSGLETYTKDFEIDTSNFWSFDDFSDKTRIHTEKYPKVLYAGLLTVLVGLIRGGLTIGNNPTTAIVSGTVVVTIGTIIILIYVFYQKKYTLLSMDNDHHVFVLHDNPNKHEFEEFIKSFYEARKANYREKYFKIDLHGDRENQIDRMKWLHRENIITGTEFEIIVEEIQAKLI